MTTHSERAMREVCTCYDHLDEYAITVRIVDGKHIHPGCGGEVVAKDKRKQL